RLRELVDAGVITRADDGDGPTYALTQAGRELAGAVGELGSWGQRWLPRTLPREELDADALLWDMHRRVRAEELPRQPLGVRIELTDVRGRAGVRFLLLRRNEVSLCVENPGFPEQLRLAASLRTLTAWWRGDISLADARAAGRRSTAARPFFWALPARGAVAR